MKKNKKKIVIITLLLFAMMGVVGYGVYSYYWTQGNFSLVSADGDNNKIRFSGSFNVWAGEQQNDSYILGYNGGITMSCTEPDSNYEVSCTGSTTIHNDGTIAVDVEILDPSYYAGSNVGEYTPTFNWTSARINAGSSKELTVYATTTIDIGSTSSEPTETSGPIDISTYVGASFKIRATQVH